MSHLFQTLRQLVSPGGIEGYFATKYAEFAKNTPEARKEYETLADRTASMIKRGRLLEIGPGPGFLSIELTRILPQMEIVGLDISDTMLEIARRNAKEHNLSERIEFRKGDASKMPFEDCSFDFVISSGSLHHWKTPVQVFNEIYRVLKSNRRAMISDLRKDAPPEKVKEWVDIIDSTIMRWGFKHSIKESYTAEQIEKLINETQFTQFEVEEEEINLEILLEK